MWKFAKISKESFGYDFVLISALEEKSGMGANQDVGNEIGKRNVVKI